MDLLGTLYPYHYHERSINHRSGIRQPSPSEDYELKETITSPPRADDKIVLHDEDCYDRLGFSCLTRKKWTILFAVFFV